MPVRRGVGGAATLPQSASLVADWRGADFNATRVAIPNRVQPSVPLSSNLCTTTRSVFNITRYFTKTNATVADSVTAGPNGLTQASTVVWGSADATLVMAAPGSFAIGTYTFSMDIKTTDAATVTVRMGANGAFTNKTVNGTWTTYSITFTLGSAVDPALTLRSLDAATPANLAIDNWRCHAGSSDLGRDTLAGHIYFGRSKYDTTRHPTSTSGNIIVQGAANRYGFCQFETDISLTDYTVMMIGKRTGTNTFSQYAFVKAEDTSAWVAQYADADNNAAMVYGGSTAISASSAVGPFALWAEVGDWSVITQRYSGSEASMWMDDLKCRSATVAGRSATIRNLIMHHSPVGSSSNFTFYDFYACAIWNRALTDAELAQAYNYYETLAAADSIDLSPSTVVLVAEGDSITSGVGASSVGLGSYAKKSNPNLSPRASGPIAAISGSTLANVVSREAANIAALPATKRGRSYVYSLLIGRNDHAALIAGGQATYATDVAAHIARMKAAGFDKAVLMTVLPSTLASYNAARNTLNAIYTGASWASSRGITICDFAANATMGPDAAASDAGLYPDGTHPNDAGYTALEPTFRATMNAL